MFFLVISYRAESFFDFDMSIIIYRLSIYECTLTTHEYNVLVMIRITKGNDIHCTSPKNGGQTLF